MALPTKAKTWEFSHVSNTLSGVSKTDYDSIFIQMKAALKSGTTPMTIAGSSNGTTAALDGVDRIAASANIVNAGAGVAHSWIVFNLVGMGSAQFLFEWIDPNNRYGAIKFSPGGLFTGGSTTASPTATDSQTLQSSNAWMGDTGAGGGQIRAHVMRSTDGKNTRVFFCGNSVVLAFWSFETPVQASTGWTLPYIAMARTIGNSFSTNSLLNASALLGVLIYFAQGPLGTMNLYTTFEGFANTWVGARLAAPNELSGEVDFCGLGLYHDTTVGQRGRHGYVPDMWFTAQGPVNGDTYPNDGSRQFQQMGQMIVPSDGTSWLIS